MSSASSWSDELPVRQRTQVCVGCRERASVAPPRLIQQSTDASEADAPVLASQEFVANGGGRPWSARNGAASPGRTGSRGRIGRRGWGHSTGAAPSRTRWSSRFSGGAAVSCRRRQGWLSSGPVARLLHVVGGRYRALRSPSDGAALLGGRRQPTFDTSGNCPVRTLSFQSVGVAMSSIVMSMWVSRAPVRAGTWRSMIARTAWTSASIAGP